MATRRRRAETTDPGPRSYQMSGEALVALNHLGLALDLPKCKVLELAILHLRDDWRAGRVRGIALQVTPDGEVE
jgi:hypothetical protein